MEPNENFNNNFLNSENNKLFLESTLDYFRLINQMNDVDQRITVLEKERENTIENIIKTAERMNKGMTELKETISFENDVQELSYDYLMDALHEFTTKWK
jgi:hypothetical protein